MNPPFLILALGLSSVNAVQAPQTIHRCEMKAGGAIVTGFGMTANNALLLASELCLSKAGSPLQCAWENVKCDEVPAVSAVKVVTTFANAHPELAERITQRAGHACRVDGAMNSYSAFSLNEKTAKAEAENDCLQNDPFGDACKKERVKCINLAEATGARPALARSLSANVEEAAEEL